MNKASILDGLNKSKRLLKLSDIEFTENTRFPRHFISPSKFSDEFIRISQKSNYDLIHKTALENGDYDFIISDYSFFQFSLDDTGVIRYAYYQSSRAIPSYEDFMKSIGFSIDDYTNLLDEDRPFQSDYLQIISEAKLANSVTPIRYDYNEDQNQNILHSASHLHIGHENNIRIPLAVVLTPQSFVGFVLRHMYSDKWKTAMANENFLEEYLACKNSCLTLDLERFNADEKKDLYLN